MNKLKETTFEFYLDNRDFFYLRLKDGEEFRVSDIEKIQEYIRENYNGVQKPFLAEFGYGSTLAEGIQEHLSKSLNRFSTADAVLISTFAHKLIAQFYLKHYKPSRPTKIFNDIFEALEWIEKQR